MHSISNRPSSIESDKTVTASKTDKRHSTDIAAANMPTANSSTANMLATDVYSQLEDDQHDLAAGLNRLVTDYEYKQSLINDFRKKEVSSNRELSISDFVDGVTQLTITGVIETNTLVEAMHREIMLRPIGLFNDRFTRLWRKGPTGRIYQVIRMVTRIVGSSLATGMHYYQNLNAHREKQALPSGLKKLVSVLNGVMGDHLVTNDNKLALPMTLYTHDCLHYKKQTLNEREHASVKYSNFLRNKTLQKQHNDLSDNVFLTPQKPQPLSGRIVIMAHGLCMSHLHWSRAGTTSLGSGILTLMPDATLLYLDYNTGKRISRNGRLLTKLLQDLVVDNPGITSMTLIGHSMGGLVFRSAFFYAKHYGHKWTNRVDKLFTLGTPNHGAGLERIGDYVQKTIGKLPYAGSLAKLGNIRSEGIIDLRYGSIVDEDWKNSEPRDVLPDMFRTPAPLSKSIKTYAIAGMVARSSQCSKTSQQFGDGLVTISSALGEHEAEQALFIPEGRKAIFYGVSHMGLVTDSRVQQQILSWLNDEGDKDRDRRLDKRIESYPKPTAKAP